LYSKYYFKNLGVAGVGGSLHSPKGIQIASYACGLGNVKTNIVEDYALWEGIKVAREMRITKIVILGLSMMVALEIIKRFASENNIFNSIIPHTLSLLEESEEVKIYHNKLEFNMGVDYWANL
jgi:hypothetical protein